MHNKLQIIYKHNKPYGIRDENGFLFFFTEVSKFPNQEERYRQEVQEQFALADYLLASLQARGLTKRAVDLPNESRQPSWADDGLDDAVIGSLP